MTAAVRARSIRLFKPHRFDKHCVHTWEDTTAITKGEECFEAFSNIPDLIDGQTIYSNSSQGAAFAEVSRLPTACRPLIGYSDQFVRIKLILLNKSPTALIRCAAVEIPRNAASDLSTEGSPVASSGFRTSIRTRGDEVSKFVRSIVKVDLEGLHG